LPTYEIDNLENDEEFLEFFRTHYELKVVPTLTPVFYGIEMHFPKEKKFIKRQLTLLEKLRYYWRDFKIWWKNGKLNKQVTELGG